MLRIYYLSVKAQKRVNYETYKGMVGQYAYIKNYPRRTRKMFRRDITGLKFVLSQCKTLMYLKKKHFG